MAYICSRSCDHLDEVFRAFYYLLLAIFLDQFVVNRYSRRFDVIRVIDSFEESGFLLYLSDFKINELFFDSSVVVEYGVYDTIVIFPCFALFPWIVVDDLL